jgi:hypothetical protein
MKRLVMRRTRVCVTALVAVVGGMALSVTGGSGAASVDPPRWVLKGPYVPSLDPLDFVARVDNRYLPLVPGTAFHYRGYSGMTPQTDDMVVTRQTKVVLGIRCTVVRDTVSEHGTPVERTFDWYAQDKQGNVWYLGENSLERKNERFVRADDSWQAGVDRAKAGIVMKANPRPGDVYRQEYYPPGGALDQALVLRTRPTITVPHGSYRRTLATVEWSPVEPQLERKYYVAGLGEVAEQVVQGGHERFQLVSVTS